MNENFERVNNIGICTHHARVTDGNFIAGWDSIKVVCIAFTKTRSSADVSLTGFYEHSAEWVCNVRTIRLGGGPPNKKIIIEKNNKTNLDKIVRWTHLVTVKEGEQAWRRLWWGPLNSTQLYFPKKISNFSQLVSNFVQKIFNFFKPVMGFLSMW